MRFITLLYYLGIRSWSKEEETPVDLCRRAIILYLNTLSGETSPRHIQSAEQDAAYLAERGDEGLRLGAPRSLHAKLKYWRGQFSVSRGDASHESAQAWEHKVGEVFTAAGLPFAYHYRKPDPERFGSNP